ncbi:MAG TPA: sodium:calcium antiporter [Nitrospiria bacterium]
MIWLEFVVCTTLILISGSLLSRYGNILSETTGMGRTWIGLILLGTVTSLPELATGLSAVTVADVPEIAVGDVLGSCVFNLMLIGLMDWFYRPGPILSHVDQGHILLGGFGVLLIGTGGTGLFLGSQNISSEMGWMGLYSPLIFILWVVAVRKIFSHEKNRMKGLNPSKVLNPKSLDQEIGVNLLIYPKVFLNAGVIIAAGMWLPYIGNRISEVTGWGDTFVGTLLVAASTSLPEIVTSFSALRLGAPDLAVANLLGSNLFNMAVLSLDDFAYLKGPLLSHVSFTHLISVFSALMMTGVCIVGVLFRAPKKELGFLSWEGFALMILYIFNALILFYFSNMGIS